MAFWASLPIDVLSFCVQSFEDERDSASIAMSTEFQLLTETLNAMSLVCWNWRRVVLKNLRQLSPRGTFQSLPVLLQSTPKLRILDLRKCKLWIAADFHGDPVADLTKDTERLYCYLASLSTLTELSELYVRHLSDAAIPKIASIARLRSLHVGGYHSLSNHGVQPLSKLTNLLRLEFENGGRMQSLGFQFLSHLSLLQSLTLHNCQLDDAALEYISHLSNLSHLSLASCQHINGSGFHHLEMLSEIVSIDLSGTGVLPEAIRHFSSLGKLRTLNLSFCHHLLPSSLISSVIALSLTSLTLLRCESITLENALEINSKLQGCNILFQKAGDVYQETIQLLK